MNRTRWLLLVLWLFGVAALAADDGAVRQLAGELERAKRKAAYNEWLYTEGVLAKAEAEQTQLLVFRLKNDLETARLQLAKEEAQAAPGDKSRAALATAQESAETASREWRHAELDAALLNLKRQQKLYGQGVVPRSDVTRAEEAVDALKAEKK